MDIEFPRKERDFMDLERIDQSLRDASMIWLARKIELFEENALVAEPRILSTRVALESDRSFATYEEALAHVTGPPLGNDVSIFWEQGLLDVLFEYPIRSDQSHFSLHMAFDRLGIRVVTALRFMPPGGVVRAYELEGDAGPGAARPALDPGGAALREPRVLSHSRWHRSPAVPLLPGDPVPADLDAGPDRHRLHRRALNHADCRRVQLRTRRPLVSAADRNAHRDVDRLHGARKHCGRRTAPSLADYLPLRLVHGFGFSFGLQHTLQFAGSHLLTSLLSFNIGVELGQLLVLVLMVPALGVLFRYVVAERIGTIILSAIVAHTAWHWMTDRYAVLQQFPWPAITAADAASAIRWLMLLIVLAAGAYLLGRAGASAHDSDTPRTPGRVPKSGPALRTESPE
jgi:hypothetical protein